MPDYFAFESDRQPQSTPSQSMRSSFSTTTVPHDAFPRDATDEEFPTFIEITDEEELIEEPLEFDSILFDTDFDHSCLLSLDRQLLLRLMDSFIDVCWAEAVGDNTSPYRQSVHLYAPSDNYQSCSDDSDLTPNDGRSLHSPVEFTQNFVNSVRDSCVNGCKQSNLHLQTQRSFPRSAASSRLSTPTDDNQHDQVPLVYLDAHYPICDPNDTVHFFPISPLASRRAIPDRKLPHTRIAAFCSNLPGRLVKSAGAS